MRVNWRLAIVAFGVLPWLTSCKAAEPATEIVVVVDADLPLAEKLTRLDVSVQDPEHQDDALGSLRLPVDMASRDAAGKLPLSFAMTAPRDALDRRIMLVVTATGWAAPGEGEAALARHKVIAAFEPKRSLRLDVFLAAACIGQLCESESDVTCDRSGECGPIAERSDLPAANGGPLGGYVSLRGSSGDAGVDGAGDGQVSEEAGPRYDGAIEAGTRCAATERACDDGVDDDCDDAEDCDDSDCAEAPGCEVNACRPKDMDPVECGVNELCRDVGGSAKCDCKEGYERCGEDCVDLTQDADNCGRCGYACAGSLGCSEGDCDQAVHELVLGEDMSCALLESGGESYPLKCWGAVLDRNSEVGASSSLGPRSITGVPRVRGLAITQSRVCVIDPEKDLVKCWGFCGKDCGTPEPTFGDDFHFIELQGVDALSTTRGFNYLGGIGGSTCLLRVGEILYCAGYSPFTTSDSDSRYVVGASPLRAVAIEEPNNYPKFSQIRSNRMMTCGITVERRVACWPTGVCQPQPLGTGCSPEQAVGAYLSLESGGSPLEAVRMELGQGGMCIMTAGDELYCAGTVVGTPDGSNSILRIYIEGDVVDLAVGNGVGCAVTSIGQAFCWGNVALIGLGSETQGDDQTKPVLVPGVSDFRELAIGSEHACGRRGSGEVVCWGNNDAGQLGDGTAIKRSKPVSVKGLF